MIYHLETVQTYLSPFGKQQWNLQPNLSQFVND